MWPQLAVLALGVWITASPDIMAYEGPERINNHIVGPLIVSAAMIAAAETTRAVRWANVLLGAWLVLAPIFLHYEPLHIGVRSGLIGLIVAALSWRPGASNSRQGGGWTALWTRSQPAVGPGLHGNQASKIRRKAG